MRDERRPDWSAVLHLAIENRSFETEGVCTLVPVQSQGMFVSAVSDSPRKMALFSFQDVIQSIVDMSGAVVRAQRQKGAVEGNQPLVGREFEARPARARPCHRWHTQVDKRPKPTNV